MNIELYERKHKMISFNELRVFCESNPENDYMQKFNNCIKLTTDNDFILFDNMKVSVNGNVTSELLTHSYSISESEHPREHLDDLIHIIDECIKNSDINKIADKFESYMDNNNKKAYNVLKNQGADAAIEHMFKDPQNPDRKLSYSEMRYYYG